MSSQVPENPNDPSSQALMDPLELKHPKKRWYDYQSNTTMALDLLKTMNPDYGFLMAQAFLTFTEENTLVVSKGGLKSFGAKKILSFIRSQLKRRWYDRHPLFYRAVHQLLLMSDRDRQDAAYYLRVSLEAVQKYVTKQTEAGELVDIDEIKQISQEIFGRDMDELKQLTHPDFSGDAFERPREKDSKVVSEESGMKVSQDET